MLLVVSVLVGNYIVYRVVSDILIQIFFHYGYHTKIFPTATTATTSACCSDITHHTDISEPITLFFADVF